MKPLELWSFARLESYRNENISLSGFANTHISDATLSRPNQNRPPYLLFSGSISPQRALCWVLEGRSFRNRGIGQ
jgi:hypothetical protein